MRGLAEIASMPVRTKLKPNMKTISIKTIQERQALELQQLETKSKLQAKRDKYLLIAFGILTAVILAI